MTNKKNNVNAAFGKTWSKHDFGVTASVLLAYFDDKMRSSILKPGENPKYIIWERWVQLMVKLLLDQQVQKPLIFNL